MESSSGTRLSLIKQRLRALEYHEPLTADSLALVEHLVGDIVTTTESYQNLVDREAQTAQDLAQSQAQLFPLRKENSKLLRENNALHLRIIKAAEEVSAKGRSSFLEQKKLEGEIMQMQLLDKQRSVQQEAMVRQMEGLQEALRQAQAMAGCPDQLFIDQEKVVYSTRQELESTWALSPRTDGASADSVDAPIDQAEATSDVTEKLVRQLQEARLHADNAASEASKLRAGISSREEEIARLSKLLESDRDYDRMSLQHAHQANKRIAEQLSGQVDFLNNQLSIREAQLEAMQADLGASQAKARELGAENARLLEQQRTLSSLQRQAQRKNASPQRLGRDPAAAAEDSSEDEVSLPGSSDDEEAAGESSTLLAQLAKERKNLARESAASRKKVQDAEAEVAELRGQVQSLLTEKSELMAVISRLNEEAQDQGPVSSEAAAHVEELNQALKQTQQLASNLQEERKRLMALLEDAKDLAEKRAQEAAGAEQELRDAVAEKEKELHAANEGLLSAHEEAAGLKEQVSALERAAVFKVEEVAGLEQSLQDLRALRPQESEVDVLQKRLRHSQAKLTEAELRGAEAKSELGRRDSKESILAQRFHDREAELDSIALERDRARHALKANYKTVQDLTEQKARLEDEVSESLRKYHGEVEQVALLSGNIQDLQSDLERKTQAIQALQVERASLTERLIAEERRTAEVRSELSQVAVSMTSHRTRAEASDGETERLKADMTALEGKRLAAEAELAKMRAECKRYSASVEALEQQLSVVRAVGSEKEHDLVSAKNLIRQLEISREELKSQVDDCYKKLTDETTRATAAEVRCDSLQRELEDKGREVVGKEALLEEMEADREALQDLLNKEDEARDKEGKEQESLRLYAEELEGKISKFQLRASELSSALEESHRTSENVSSEKEKTEAKYRGLKETHELVLRELRAVENDLEMVTRENQAVTSDLARVSSEKDALLSQAAQASHQLAMADHAAKAAKLEARDLLTTYTAVCDEKRRLEGGLDEVHAARERLAKTLDERETELPPQLARATVQREHTNAELQRRVVDIATYKRQAECVSARLHRSEHQLQACRSDNDRLMRDLRECRAFSADLGERFQALQRDQAAAAEGVLRLRGEAQMLSQECEGLRSKVQQERKHRSDLEQVIERSRLKEAALAKEVEDAQREQEHLAVEVMHELQSQVAVSQRLAAQIEAGGAEGEEAEWAAVMGESYEAGRVSHALGGQGAITLGEAYRAAEAETETESSSDDSASVAAESLGVASDREGGAVPAPR